MSDADDEKGTVIIAQLEVEDCTAELYLNDIPVLRLVHDPVGPSEQPLRNVAVQHLIIPGDNKLEVLVEPGPTPSVARYEQREMGFRAMKATARLLRFVEGVPMYADNGEVLGQAVFEWRDGRPDQRTFPIAEWTMIGMGQGFGRWGWQDAPALTLDEATVAEASQLLDRMHRAISEARGDEVWRLAELQLEDVQRAYPVTRSMLEQDMADRMDLVSTMRRPVLDLERDAYDFRLVADRRMIQLVNRDYSTSLKLRHSKGLRPVPYRIMVARIGGELRIVR